MEPPLNRTKRGVVQGRWRWYYHAIADYRLSHPGCQDKDVAAHVQRSVNYINIILNSDIYKEYEARRRQEKSRETDLLIRDKLTGLTMRALDSMTEQFEKKKDQIPLDLAREVATSGLDRLGFGPQKEPQVVVNNNQVMVEAVSPAALEEARMAMRAVERMRVSAAPAVELEVEPSIELPVGEASGAREAETAVEDVGDATSATDS